VPFSVSPIITRRWPPEKPCAARAGCRAPSLAEMVREWLPSERADTETRNHGALAAEQKQQWICRLRQQRGKTPRRRSQSFGHEGWASGETLHPSCVQGRLSRHEHVLHSRPRCTAGASSGQAGPSGPAPAARKERRLPAPKTAGHTRQVIKMQLPIRWRRRNGTPESPQPAPSRPSTIIDLLAKILETEENAAIFAKTVSKLMVVGTACFIASALAVHFAAKGIKLPQHEILPFGLGGASLLTLATVLARGLIKKIKASRGDEDSDHTPDGKQ
jgi:hypothetical protein